MVAMSKTVSVSTKLTEEILKGIDRLVERGEYTSRSEALRDAARMLIRAQRGLLKGSAFREQIGDEEREQALNELAREKNLTL